MVPAHRAVASECSQSPPLPRLGGAKLLERLSRGGDLQLGETEVAEAAEQGRGQLGARAHQHDAAGVGDGLFEHLADSDAVDGCARHVVIRALGCAIMDSAFAHAA